jgi:IS5 family transposase
MDNRAGLCADLVITDARLSEPRVAEQLLARQRRKRVPIDTLGADKGYCNKVFVAHLRERGIRPHIARIAGIERTQLYACFAASAYNLLRMARLAPLVT